MTPGQSVAETATNYVNEMEKSARWAAATYLKKDEEAFREQLKKHPESLAHELDFICAVADMMSEGYGINAAIASASLNQSPEIMNLIVPLLDPLETLPEHTIGPIQQFYRQATGYQPQGNQK